MSSLSQDQIKGLEIAHVLVDMGAPVFTAFRNSSTGDFLYPADWQNKQPSHAAVDAWRPGKALCMVTGVVFDVIDIDPRNGGDLAALDGIRPRTYGLAHTPSAGTHLLIARTHLAKGKPATGIDLQAGADDGSGRGFVFIAPTVRVSKYGPNEGKPVAYQWIHEPTKPDASDVDSLESRVHRAFIDLCAAGKRNRQVVRPDAPKGIGAEDAQTPRDDDAFYDAAEQWTAAEAWRLIDDQCQAVADAPMGEVNGTLGGAARVLGRFVAGGFLSEEDAAGRLMEAVGRNAVHDDGWNVANRKGWTAATCIGAGLARGQEEPWTVTAPDEAAPPNPAEHSVRPVSPAAPRGTVSALEITSAADMAYWLQSVLGSGSLSGFFLRGGRVVHTPRVDEAGYVAPRAEQEDNGPAQVQAVSPGQLTAQIQYAHRCYKRVDVKDPETGKKTGEKQEVLALFPLEAAKRAVDAPDAMVMLRVLKGITVTPMVRADGSILDRPGYDRESGYLFLPDPGVSWKPVPESPTLGDAQRAVALLDEMTAQFPWQSADDRANYYGLLLTPLMRLLTPPSYKLFGITAHQPGSGKTLLADIARIIHGGVFRTEFPVDEAEVSKMVSSVLVTTSAPIVHVDNVWGVLKSSALAGFLTADGDIQERELGKSSNIVFRNDRTWVFTANNFSVGGDLARRTIVIDIDPNMVNPESRSFAIPDLKAWVLGRRPDLLAALLTMIRYWVGQGARPAVRRQSDSFARWEAAVGGILAACGVPGVFDDGSGKRAAVGGDDDGLADVLAHIHGMKGDGRWTVADVLSGQQAAEIGDWVEASRDWLPGVVLDKLARSEAAGRSSLGYWLRNRYGRWVSTEDGRAFVLRKEGKDKYGQNWRVESNG